MTDTSLIEAVQNAIDWALPGDDAKEAIRAYLSALDEAGWVVTLKDANVSMLARATLLDDEPTKDDERRAAMAVDSYPAASSRGLRSDVIAAVAMMARDHRAMVSASPPPPGAYTLEKKL